MNRLIIAHIHLIKNLEHKIVLEVHLIKFWGLDYSLDRILGNWKAVTGIE